MTQQIADIFDEVLCELYEHIHHKGTRGLWFFKTLPSKTLSFKYEFAGYKKGTNELIEFHYPIETVVEMKIRIRKESPTYKMTYSQYKDYKIKWGYI